MNFMMMMVNNIGYMSFCMVRLIVLENWSNGNRELVIMKGNIRVIRRVFMIG